MVTKFKVLGKVAPTPNQTRNTHPSPTLLQKLKLMTLYFMTLSKSVIIEGIQ